MSDLDSKIKASVKELFDRVGLHQAVAHTFPEATRRAQEWRSEIVAFAIENGVSQAVAEEVLIEYHKTSEMPKFNQEGIIR